MLKINFLMHEEEKLLVVFTKSKFPKNKMNVRNLELVV